MVQKAAHPRFSPRTQRSGTNRAAFTLIELLVVAAIIILLLALLVVGLNAATRTAQKTRTAALMNSMKQGLIRFKEDIGYYPPMLGPNAAGLRNLFNPPVPGSATYNNAIQDWWSSCAMADYLIGYGDHRFDGYGYVSGQPGNLDWEAEAGLGIRHPGPDGVWNAGTTAYTNRMKMNGNYGSEAAPWPIDQGKVFGPYLELKDDRLMGSVDGTQDAYGNQVVRFQGDAGFDPTKPQVICDYWGVPIRYFRRPYPIGALGQSYRSVDRNGDGTIDGVPTLSDVFVLRPYTVKAGTESDGIPDGNADTTTSRNLDAAEFALFSAGPDKALNTAVRADSDELNKDNIVEVGP